MLADNICTETPVASQIELHVGFVSSVFYTTLVFRRILQSCGFPVSRVGRGERNKINFSG